MNRAASLFILFILGFESVSGQTCNFTLSGAVQEKNGDPLPGATVLLSGKSTVADSEGKFVFRGLCPGSAQLSVKYIGYADQHVTMDLAGDKYIVVTLIASETTLEEVAVTGNNSSSVTSLTNTSYTLSGEALDHFKGKSLGEALKRVPGVSALQTGPAIFKPVIDGLHSQRVLLLNNGIRQEGQQWGVEHAPEIDPFIASEIKVVKGSETVRYGSDAIGGVIIIDTPPMHQAQKFGGELNAGFSSNNRMGVFSGLLEGGFKSNQNISWRLQSSVKKGGDYSAPDYVLSNTGVQELNFSGALGLKAQDKGMGVYFSSFNTEIGILRTAHSGSTENLNFSFQHERPWYIRDFTYNLDAPRQRINHQLLKISGYRKIPGVGTLNLLYGGQYNQRKEYDIRRGGRSEKPALSLDLFSNVLDLFLEHRVGKLEGSIGVNGTYKDNSNVPETGTRPLIPNYRQVNAGLFLLEKYRTDKWLVEGGVRIDHQYLRVISRLPDQELVKPDFNFTYVSGSFGFSYYFNHYSRISSHASLAIRPPHVSELYSDGLHRGLASVEYGLLNQDGFQTDARLVRKEISTKWTNGFQFIKSNFSVELTAHLNHISNYVYLRPDGTERRASGVYVVFDYAQTEALLTGIDGLLHWDIGRHIEYAGTFAFLYAQDVAHKDVLTFIPPAQMEHSLTYRTSLRKKQELFFTISAPVVFTQTRAPRTVYPADAETYEGSKVYDFAPAPDGYLLLNAEAGIKVPVREHALSISIDGENLLNKSYRVYMNRLRYFADEPGANIMLRLKYNFHSDE